MAAALASLHAHHAHTTPTPASAPDSPPVHLTRFIGRERELERVRQSIAATRLVTLTGAGGSGKSRLAAEVTTRLAGLPIECARWIELASLTDGAMLPDFAVGALGIRDRGDLTATASIAAELGRHRSLLVLDNCEHLIDDCARFAESLLHSCDTLRILVTSRQPLGISGELAWLVPPLSLPADANDVAATEQSEAVQLFVARARDVAPTFALSAKNGPAVVQICRQLGGLPLAIELAAARTKVLTPEQIAGRLANVFSLLTSGSRTALARHRTLRATMDWSYDLLNEPERLLLQRIAVFHGDFSLDAAEAVCACQTLAVDDVLDTLSALVDKSLIVVATGESTARYRLLEPVRQYAAERLRQSGEEEIIRQRHAEHFLNVVESAEPNIFAVGHDSEWMRLLEADDDNIRGAFEWALRSPSRGEIAMRLAYGLHWYWYAQGLFREAKQRVDASLAMDDGVAPGIRARALIARGQVAFWRGDLADLLPPMREAVELLRGTDSPRDLAYALAGEGSGLALMGDVGGSNRAFEDAVALVDELADTGVLAAFVHYSRGRVAYATGDLMVARTSFEKALECERHTSACGVVAHSLTGLGRVDLDEGRVDSASLHLAESLRLHRVTRDLWGTVVALIGLARVAAPSNPRHAATLVGAAEALRERMGVRLLPFRTAEHDRLVADVRRSLGDSELTAAFETGSRLDLDSAIGFALAQVGESPEPPSFDKAEPNVASPPIIPPDDAVPCDLRVLALGPLDIECHGTPVSRDAWRSGKPRELLLYLLVHRAGRTRDEVGLSFWPDASPSEVKNNFHVTLHRLRRVLGDGEWIGVEGDRYRIASSVRVAFDLARFEQDVPASTRALGAGDTTAAVVLDGALRTYRGDFGEGERFGDWHVGVRDRLSRLYADGLLVWAGFLAHADRLSEAIEAYRRLIARDPLNETAYRMLMSTLARQGDRAQALRLYHQLTTLLDAELDAAPSPETARLHEELQRA